MKAIVSVILPIYNTEKYLSRCIDSVLNQTFTDIEIILVDDGSNDNSGKLADDYASKFNHIKVIHEPNSGASEARRKGIHAATGEYIMFVDSDDEILPDAIKFLYEKCINHDLDIAYGSMRRIIPSNKETHDLKHPFEKILSGNDFLKYLLDLKCVCGNCACVSRKKLWSDDVFPDKNMVCQGEDVYTNIKLSLKIRNCGIYNKTLYNYYYNPLSTSSTGRLLKQSIWKTYFKSIRIFLKDNNVLTPPIECSLRILEIDRLAFYLTYIDKSDPWVQQVVSYDNSAFPIKTKILQYLIRHSLIRNILIKANRKIKKLF